MRQFSTHCYSLRLIQHNVPFEHTIVKAQIYLEHRDLVRSWLSWVLMKCVKPFVIQWMMIIMILAYHVATGREFSENSLRGSEIPPEGVEKSVWRRKWPAIDWKSCELNSCKFWASNSNYKISSQIFQTGGEHFFLPPVAHVGDPGSQIMFFWADLTT